MFHDARCSPIFSGVLHIPTKNFYATRDPSHLEMEKSFFVCTFKLEIKFMVELRWAFV